MGREQHRNRPKPLAAAQVPHAARVCLARKVDASHPAGCWLWKGHVDRKGYGQIKVAGKAMWAHRVAYALWAGEIPEGMTVDHTCRNPSCVNPRHLRLLTIEENTRKGNEDRAMDLPV